MHVSPESTFPSPQSAIYRHSPVQSRSSTMSYSHVYPAFTQFASVVQIAAFGSPPHRLIAVPEMCPQKLQSTFSRHPLLGSWLQTLPLSHCSPNPACITPSPHCSFRQALEQPSSSALLPSSHSSGGSNSPPLPHVPAVNWHNIEHVSEATFIQEYGDALGSESE